MSASDLDKDLLVNVASYAGAPVVAATMVAVSTGDLVVTTALAGTALAGFVQSAIGARFKNRAERLVTELVERIDTIEDEVHRLLAKERLNTESGQDLALQGYLLAGTSSGENRISQIISILTNGLTADQLDHARTKILLNLFAELDEVDVVVLQSFIGSGEFKETHHEVLKDAHNPWNKINLQDALVKDYRPTTEEVKKAEEATPRHVIFKSRLNHLIALGLVGPKNWEHSTDMAITELGSLLLQEIGVTAERVRADGIIVTSAALFVELRQERVELRRLNH